jgi:hypothetical protein
MHPPLPAKLEETQTSAAPDAAILEADIAALVKAAGGSLRGQGGDRHWDTEQVPMQLLLPDANEPSECPASALRNTEFKVAETCPERRTGGPDIRTCNADRISDASKNARATRTALFTGVLIGTMGTVLVFGSALLLFDIPLSKPPQQRDHALAQLLGAKNITFGGSETDRKTTSAARSADKSVAVTANVLPHRPDSALSAARRPLTAQQNTISSAPASGVGRGPTILSKPMSFPETRPTTIEGWMVRDVIGGTVILEGPDGVWSATRGDTVPGVGTVDTIVRWGSRWVVATPRGLISTP